MTPDLETIKRVVLDAGVFEIGEVSMADLVFEPEIRRICEGNMCRSYGGCWACPPAVGTLAECEERCRQYDRFLLFNCRYPLKSSFDIKGMMTAMREFKTLTEKAADALRPLGLDYMLLSNEGCGKCAKCTWPDAPCRFPDRLYHSIEGYGFNVTRLSKLAGLHYNTGPGTVTYFGALLYKE